MFFVSVVQFTAIFLGDLVAVLSEKMKSVDFNERVFWHLFRAFS